MKFLRANWPLLVIIPLFAFLFFFRFDWATLANWDEAWYGSIARNIASTGNFLKMEFNGKPYYDHPPMGFILMAASVKLFGATAFAVRLPSVMLGLLSAILIYFLAKEMFGEKLIGFASSLILGTSVWYLLRVRSGDLDSPFIFFYLLTVFLSYKSVKKFALFPLTCISLAALVLTKTMVGWSAIILVLAINLRQVFSSWKNFFIALFGVLLFFGLVLPWYYIQATTYSHFIEEHFFNVGMRGRGLASYFKLQPALAFFYLHMGVRKWYYIWLAALGLIVVTFRFIKKPFFLVLLWNLVILYPFLTTNETHIWHLIPVYLPMALIISSGIFWGKQLFVKITKLRKLDGLFNLAYVAIFVIIAGLQIKNFYKEVYPTSIYTPYDVDVSKAVAKYKQKIYLDDDFYPIAIYYSGKRIYPLVFQTDGRKSAIDVFKSDDKDFVLITRNYVLNLLKENDLAYKVDYKNQSFSIISRPTSQP